MKSIQILSKSLLEIFTLQNFMRLFTSVFPFFQRFVLTELYYICENSLSTKGKGKFGYYLTLLYVRTAATSVVEHEEVLKSDIQKCARWISLIYMVFFGLSSIFLTSFHFFVMSKVHVGVILIFILQLLYETKKYVDHILHKDFVPTMVNKILTKVPEFVDLPGVLENPEKCQHKAFLFWEKEVKQAITRALIKTIIYSLIRLLGYIGFLDRYFVKTHFGFSVFEYLGDLNPYHYNKKVAISQEDYEKLIKIQEKWEEQEKNKKNFFLIFLISKIYHKFFSSTKNEQKSNSNN